MNAITPMKPWKTWILRLVFFILGAFKSKQQDLIQLSFIHFARWVIVRRDAFPKLSDAQPAEQLQYDYLLFFSNFNGTWDQYIDAFSAVLYDGLDKIWKWSEKYPGSRPVTGFKRYIELVQFDTDYYFNVYPHATTNDVKAAFKVHDALTEFAKTSQSLSPAEFEKAWLQFQIAVTPHLGMTGIAPVGT